jgi:hypothetical protein
LVTKWLKDTFEGDKCQVEGMQYILLALVYFFWGVVLLFMWKSLVKRRGSNCIENSIITLSATISL